MQQDLNKIIGLFEKVGLKTNEKKTKYMVFRGPAAPFSLSDKAYARRCTGKGESYEERRKAQVKCDICGKEMKQGSLQRHMMQQHNKKPEQYLYNNRKGGGIFNINFRKGKNNKCPIPGCCGSSNSKYGIYRHSVGDIRKQQ